MKVWKRIIAAMLFLLICGNAMALEETETFVDFNAKLTDGMGISSTEWFSTSLNRAMLTTCLAFDLKVELGNDFDFYDMLTSPSYVGFGKSDFSLVVIGKNNVTVFEDYEDAEFETDAEFILSENCSDYYKNDVAEIEACIGVFEKTTNEFKKNQSSRS